MSLKACFQLSATLLATKQHTYQLDKAFILLQILSISKWMFHYSQLKLAISVLELQYLVMSEFLNVCTVRKSQNCNILILFLLYLTVFIWFHKGKLSHFLKWCLLYDSSSDRTMWLQCAMMLGGEMKGRVKEAVCSAVFCSNGCSCMLQEFGSLLFKKLELGGNC